MVDRASRWPEALPLKSTTAEAVADSFASGWVARFGVPGKVTTDRGTQFISATWKSLCSCLGIQHSTTTAYHPQSNGLVERFHRQLKQSLRARDCGTAWADHLPWALLGLRAAPKEDSAVSAAEAVYGTALNLPGQVHSGGGEYSPSKKIELRERNYKQPGAPSILQNAEFVYVRRGAIGGPFKSSYSGPYKVVERKVKVVKLQIGDKTDWVSADRLKPHTGAAPAVAEPSKRGRPPGSGGKGRPGSGGPSSRGGGYCSGSQSTKR